MNKRQELKKISAKVKKMQHLAEELSKSSGDFPALQRNIVRIAASLAMLELNVSDFIDTGS